MSTSQSFPELPALAAHLRSILTGPADEPEKAKRFILLYAHNGVGKTRLSMAFKDIGRQGDNRDTLYYNAFTEDLFSWDNDLDQDQDRKLVINARSRFFDGLDEMDMDNLIRPLIRRYVDFDFQIDTGDWVVRFYRPDKPDQPIKISRGEETMFVWCFFLAIMQMAMDGATVYQWVKYIVVDDPISSLDEHNAISVANHLVQFVARTDHQIKTMISTHHPLFFNVLWNELAPISKKKKVFSPYLLSRKRDSGLYTLEPRWQDRPFFHHLELLRELCRAREADEIYTHHFNALRSLLEKASIFHGHDKFSVCIPEGAEDDPDATLYGRVVNIMSHGNYSFYDPVAMLPENREHFDKVLNDLLAFYPFNRTGLVGMDA